VVVAADDKVAVVTTIALVDNETSPFVARLDAVDVVVLATIKDVRIIGAAVGDNVKLGVLSADIGDVFIGTVEDEVMVKAGVECVVSAPAVVVSVDVGCTVGHTAV
jgi:hypothetical protein